jgi:hypothetical protein
MKAVPKGVVRAVTIVLAIVAFVLVQSFLAKSREERYVQARKEETRRMLKPSTDKALDDFHQKSVERERAAMQTTPPR